MLTALIIKLATRKQWAFGLRFRFRVRRETCDQNGRRLKFAVCAKKEEGGKFESDARKLKFPLPNDSNETPFLSSKVAFDAVAAAAAKSLARLTHYNGNNLIFVDVRSRLRLPAPSR